MTSEDQLISELCGAAQRLSASGLSPGSSGNVSVRTGDRVLLSRTGADLGTLTSEDFAVLDLGGSLLDGPRPSKEFPFHTALYRRSEEFRAVLHIHSTYATAASLFAPWSARSAIPPITPYFVMRVGQTPLIPYHHPGDAAQAEVIRSWPHGFRAVLLQNHGPVVAGRTVAEAMAATLELEETCKLLTLTGSHEVAALSEAQSQELAITYGSFWEAPEDTGT